MKFFRHNFCFIKKYKLLIKMYYQSQKYSGPEWVVTFICFITFKDLNALLDFYICYEFSVMYLTIIECYLHEKIRIEIHLCYNQVQNCSSFIYNLRKHKPLVSPSTSKSAPSNSSNTIFIY